MSEETIRLILSSLCFVFAFLYALDAQTAKEDGRKLHCLFNIIISVGTLYAGRLLL